MHGLGITVVKVSKLVLVFRCSYCQIGSCKNIYNADAYDRVQIEMSLSVSVLAQNVWVKFSVLELEACYVISPWD